MLSLFPLQRSCPSANWELFQWNRISLQPWIFSGGSPFEVSLPPRIRWVVELEVLLWLPQRLLSGHEKCGSLFLVPQGRAELSFGRGVRRFRPATNFHDTVALSFVIPSEAEGSAVLRTPLENAKYYAQTELSSLRFAAPDFPLILVALAASWANFSEVQPSLRD
jgi:hypothetical protein